MLRPHVHAARPIMALLPVCDVVILSGPDRFTALLPSPVTLHLRFLSSPLSLPHISLIMAHSLPVSLFTPSFCFISSLSASPGSFDGTSFIWLQ